MKWSTGLLMTSLMLGMSLALVVVGEVDETLWLEQRLKCTSRLRSPERGIHHDTCI